MENVENVENTTLLYLFVLSTYVKTETKHLLHQNVLIISWYNHFRTLTIP